MWSLFFKSSYPRSNNQVPISRFTRLFSWRNEIPLDNPENTEIHNEENADLRSGQNADTETNPKKYTDNYVEKHVELDDDDEWSYVERPFFREEF